MANWIKGHKWLLHLLISFGLLAIVLINIDLRGTLEIIKNISIPLFILGALLFIPDRLFSAYRWFLLLRHIHPELPFFEVLRITLVSGFLGIFVPGAMGAELLRIFGLRRSNITMATAVSSVMLERYFAIIGLVALLFIGPLLSSDTLPGFATITAWISFCIIVVSLLVLFNGRARAMTKRLVPGILRKWVLPKLNALYASLDLYRGAPRVVVQGLFVGVVFQVFRTAHVYVLALSLGIEINWFTFLAFDPAIRIATLLPISTLGIGVRDAGFVVAFTLVGISAENAVALSTLFFTLTVLAALPGAFLWKWGPRTETKTLVTN